jgi:hypothetical protein
MNKRAITFAEELQKSDLVECKNLADAISDELKSEYVQQLFVKNI